jgi:hypothetical protein
MDGLLDEIVDVVGFPCVGEGDEGETVRPKLYICHAFDRRSASPALAHWQTAPTTDLMLWTHALNIPTLHNTGTQER